MVEFKTNQQTSGFVLNSPYVRVVTDVLFAGVQYGNRLEYDYYSGICLSTGQWADNHSNQSDVLNEQLNYIQQELQTGDMYLVQCLDLTDSQLNAFSKSYKKYALNFNDYSEDWHEREQNVRIISGKWFEHTFTV